MARSGLCGASLGSVRQVRNPSVTATNMAMPGSQALLPAGTPSTKLDFQCAATMPATSMPRITATFVAILMMPFARASCCGSTSSAIIPYFTGPKNALTTEKAMRAAKAIHASPLAKLIAASAATANETAFKMTVICDFERRSARRPPNADNRMNGSVNASPTIPLPPSPKTFSHGAPNATAKEITPLMMLSLAASKNWVNSSEVKPLFHRPRLGDGRGDAAMYAPGMCLLDVCEFIGRSPQVRRARPGARRVCRAVRVWTTRSSLRRCRGSMRARAG